MELSSEDNFRLNVLLANKPHAIRIDESKLIVYGLSDKGEAKIVLNPTGRAEQYVRAVKELISGHILGSPGGYPVYLRRWTRMGQMRDESLEQLLQLGEPEAVVAAVGSPGLTEELARRAWWAMEDAENARRMLENPTIVASGMGPVLASYLLDYLPFETETDKMTASIRLVLQPGLIDTATRDDLWKKSSRKQAYLLGFLMAGPDDLPQPVAARADAPALFAALGAEAQAGNPCAALLLRAAGAQGQTFLETISAILAKPPNQDVVSGAFDCLRDYFAPLRGTGDPDLAFDGLAADADAFVDAATAPASIAACLRAAPDSREDLRAMRLLSGVGYGLMRGVLRDPTTLGSLMRRKLAPVIDPLQQQISVLRGGTR
ncbi:MAG: sulfur reduction protein DsrS [Thiohalocapsa sp.]|nr:sulfur reduction protein DsrS [Thiohalocapsa sp.]MCF7991777.1 sulfur reduction protein DsrS [Thiohalocapsa sp.]